MAFRLDGSSERDLDSERIFYMDLSEETKQKALDIKGIKDYREENWDIMPLVYYYEPISSLSQSEIDDIAIAFIR